MFVNPDGCPALLVKTAATAESAAAEPSSAEASTAKPAGTPASPTVGIRAVVLREIQPLVDIWQMPAFIQTGQTARTNRLAGAE